MTFRQLQEVAHEWGAKYVCELPEGLQARVLWQADTIGYKDLVAKEISDTVDFFDTWEKATEGKTFGVGFTNRDGVVDCFTNNCVGFPFDEALDIAMDFRYIRGVRCWIYTLDKSIVEQ